MSNYQFDIIMINLFAGIVKGYSAKNAVLLFPIPTGKTDEAGGKRENGMV